MSADPKRAKDIFLAAAEMPPEARPTFLAEACGGDAGLRAAVERLLAAHDAPDSLLDRPATVAAATRDFVADTPVADTPGLPSTIDHPGPSEGVGTVVAGRYKLLECVGEGGMGSVWMAEQREPVKRLVALKLIKPGMDSRQVLARFEAERQALALMDHPHIAKVLDGGTAAHGRPYFVMELVKGLPLTDYCDDRRLSVRQRLDLFVVICSAVQHAHQKGVIHRDLKPSNVLVTEHDGRPVPKVIDFGLAKALHGPQVLTDRTLHTAYGAVVGTPLYMAPEQVGINALDVDTRADVYALGVILYELLTGTTPLDKQRFNEAAWDEMKRLIREEEPPRPSARLSSSDALPNLAASRQTEPKRLTGLVRGELDWIAMKALEKDRNRRYETANGFAADVQRYLADELVEARPPSTGYRARKFVRKHREVIAVACLIWIALLGGFAVAFNGTVRANRAQMAESSQRQRAEIALSQVTTERDRAEAAERERRAELARTASTAAKLAAKRGQWAEAIRLTQTALDLGAEDGIELTLHRIECHLALRQIKEAKADLDALAARPDLGRFTGPVLLQQAEAAMSLSNAGDPLAFARQALTHDLAPADAAYAKVFLAKSVPEAIAHIQEAHRHDPNRPRALDMLCMLLFITGRRDELRAAAARHTMLYPDSADAAMIAALVAALDRDRAGVDRALARLRHRPADELALVRVFADVLIRIQDEDFYFTGLGPELQRLVLKEWANLAPVIGRMSADPDAADRRMTDLAFVKLPMFGSLRELPAVKNAAAAGPLTLLAVVTQPGKMADLFGAVAATVQDGSLFMLHGILAEAAGRTAEAEAAYRRALAHPSFANHRKRSKFGLMMARWRLATDPNTPAADRPRWQELAVADMRELARSGSLPPDPTSFAAVVAFESGDYALALALIEDWLRQAPDAPEALTSKMNTEYRLGADDRAEATARAILGRKEAPPAATREALGTTAGLVARLYATERFGRGAALEAFLLDQCRARLGATDSGAVPTLGFLIQTHLAADRADRAVSMLAEYRAGQQARAAKAPVEVAAELAQVGSDLLRRDRPAEAEPLLRDCHLLRQKAVPGEWVTFNARSLLGGSLLAMRKYADAEPLLLDGYAGMAAREGTIPPQGKVRLPEAADRLVALYTALGQRAEAAKWRAERAKYGREPAPFPRPTR